ncbi:glycine/D-amino acid oxidase-like deaminating enzyme [Oxalobacteraceae bacterium GrIS 2.11]
MGRKHIVHNYGHGGSGWSLSWGSSTLALRLAQTTGVRTIGVIGCGALGLTSALLAQRAGMKVTIYAKALPPDVASMNASGVWTPDSRICDAEHAPGLAARWEEMARISYSTYQKMLGLPGNPIEWFDGYAPSDQSFDTKHASVADEPEYGEFNDLAAETKTHRVILPAGSHPFAHPYVARYTMMMFNISTYARMLMTDFLAMGGKIEVAQFAHAKELLKLPEHTLINATGYGARALFQDDTVIPVRGQTARLIPQTEVTYGLSTRTLSVIPRRDGILVQAFGDIGNFNNADTTPDRRASENAVMELAALVNFGTT